MVMFKKQTEHSDAPPEAILAALEKISIMTGRKFTPKSFSFRICGRKGNKRTNIYKVIGNVRHESGRSDADFTVVPGGAFWISLALLAAALVIGVVDIIRLSSGTTYGLIFAGIIVVFAGCVVWSCEANCMMCSDMTKKAIREACVSEELAEQGGQN